jgi:hypothetical protein
MLEQIKVGELFVHKDAKSPTLLKKNGLLNGYRPGGEVRKRRDQLNKEKKRSSMLHGRYSSIGDGSQEEKSSSIQTDKT